MLNEIITKISAFKPMPLNVRQPTFEPTLTISVANGIGDHTTQHRPKEVEIIPAMHGIIFRKVTLYPAQMILFRIPMPSIRMQIFCRRGNKTFIMMPGQLHMLLRPQIPHAQAHSPQNSCSCYRCHVPHGSGGGRASQVEHRSCMLRLGGCPSKTVDVGEDV
uniref:Uncharacterized protein n=1 Tax=Romanomermis culicivorax TaxID=13658 RepID=A0A915ISH6_ROMCU